MARRGLTVGAMAVLLAVGVSGCSWRIESDPEPYRTPSAVTVQRDHVAAAEAAVAAAAASSSGALAAHEATAAAARLDALGGVSPTSSPRPSGDLSAAIDAAVTQELACMGLADPLGSLCASMALSHTVMMEAADPSNVGGYDPATTLPGTAASPDALAELARQHDELRALDEVIAARSDGAERDAALARSAEHRARVEALLAIDGVSDLTDSSYDVPTDPGAELAQETALARTYAAMLIAAQPGDRLWLYNSAVVAYANAVQAGLPLADIPALPGVS